MPNYLCVNLDTGNQLVGYSGNNPGLFADMVSFAQKTSKKLNQRIAVMGQPFWSKDDQWITGDKFTSELYVAQP